MNQVCIAGKRFLKGTDERRIGMLFYRTGKKCCSVKRMVIEENGDFFSCLKKIKGSCAYMSDVITTVKGMAVNMNTSNITEFKLEEVFKKVLILMKQNLIKHRCNLIIENKLPEDVYLKGDVNNLVQVLTNLVDNAKDSMGTKGGDIVLRAWYKEQVVYISVTDSGTGISQEVKRKLFVSMYTSKGARGTGLGLYSSAGLIRGKFGGEMWVEDNPSGGSVFFVKIPLNT